MMRSEIMEMLGINNDRMKYITKTNQLDEELKLNGYKLEKQYKDGRNIIFEVSALDKIDESEEYEIYQNQIGVRDKETHMVYSEERITTGLQKSRSQFLRDLNSEKKPTPSYKTASKWDGYLIDFEAMQKDKTVYLLFNPNDETFEEITKERYNAFWRDSKECMYQLSHNKARYKKNEISEGTYDNNQYIIMNNLGQEQGTVALKFDTYKEFTNTKKMLDMIKKSKNRRLVN